MTFRQAFWLMILGVLWMSSVRAEPAQLVFDGPGKSPESLYVQEILRTAYQQIGVSVTFEPAPLARSFIEANAGSLDGLRARVGNVESDFPNLIRIPVPILYFNMVMLADRRKCGLCEISNLQQLAVTRGFRAFEQYYKEQQFDKDIVYVNRAQQAFDMVMEGRVEGAIMSSTNVPPAYHEANHHWIKRSLVNLPDYHYLHKKHAALVPKITAILKKMLVSGELSLVQDKHGVMQLPREPFSSVAGDIVAVTGNWVGYTDTEDGAYIRALNMMYGSDGNRVDVKVMNWKRAKQMFYDGAADLLVGAYSFEVSKNNIRSDLHLDYEAPVLAFAKDEQKLSAILAGEISGSACFLLGYELDLALPSNVTYYEGSQPSDCFRMLESDRIDMMLDYEIDWSQALLAKYVKRQVMEGFPLFVVFQDTQRGHLLKQVFEEKYLQLIKTGQLKTLFPNEKEYLQARFDLN